LPLIATPRSNEPRSSRSAGSLDKTRAATNVDPRAANFDPTDSQVAAGRWIIRPNQSAHTFASRRFVADRAGRPFDATVRSTH
jgi:hypothetical protein